MTDASGNSQEVARIPIVTYFDGGYKAVGIASLPKTMVDYAGHWTLIVTYFDGGYKAVGIASLPKTMVDYAGHWTLEVAIDEEIGIYLMALPNVMKEAGKSGKDDETT